LSLDELAGIEMELMKYIEGLDKSEKRLLEVSKNSINDSLILVRQWKAILQGFVMEIQKIIYDNKNGHSLVKEVEACILSDKANAVMRNSSPRDPIYTNVRPLISAISAISSVMCERQYKKVAS
jgi:hypothetical protein